MSFHFLSHSESTRSEIKEQEYFLLNLSQFHQSSKFDHWSKFYLRHDALHQVVYLALAVLSHVCLQTSSLPAAAASGTLWAGPPPACRSQSSYIAGKAVRYMDAVQPVDLICGHT